jgi:hypothetical protein
MLQHWHELKGLYAALLAGGPEKTPALYAGEDAKDHAAASSRPAGGGGFYGGGGLSRAGGGGGGMEEEEAEGVAAGKGERVCVSDKEVGFTDVC